MHAETLTYIKPGDSFAVTLTTLDEEKTAIWEPGAATPSDRVEALKCAFEAGIDTWVSMEPVIWPEDSLEIIETAHVYAGHFKIGPINHHGRLQKAVNWIDFTKEAAKLLDKLGKRYYFNKSMMKLIQ